MVEPGNSALRSCERIIRETGVLVLPDKWNDAGVLAYLRDRVDPGIWRMSQPDLGLTGILGMTVRVFVWPVRVRELEREGGVGE